MKKQPVSSKLLTWLLSLALLVLVIAALMAPRPIDWHDSFSKRDKIPFGTSLVFKSLPSLFPGTKIITAWSSPSEFLEDKIPLQTNFIYLNNVFELPAQEVRTLLNAVSAGNHVFMAAGKITGLLADTFHLSIYSEIRQLESFTGKDSVGFNFANRHLKTVLGYWYPRWMTRNYFDRYDSARTTVLGHDHLGRTNFVRVKLGKGAFYFHCNPAAFTNYHLLARDHSQYIFKALSYLPVASVVWDEHYKPNREGAQGVFDYVLKNKSLQLGWYVLLFGVLVYFVFGAKRQQRPIPVIEKRVNTTMSFAESVARLYFSRQDHLNIARKRYIYFQEYLRSRYFIDTGGPRQKVIFETALKSGIRERTVAALFKVADNLERVNYISAEDLEQFNRQIEFFYHNCR